MRKAIVLLLALCLAFACAGCGHTHTWKDATCTEPKTCSECGETEGEALGHNWADATCTEPKTCTVCGLTEGEALGHTWAEATCTEPKTCTVCGETEGEALGHSWADATCTEPKTCTVCGATEGEALGHSWAEATCTEPKTCTVCGETEGEALGHSWAEATCTEPKTCTVCGETEGEALGHSWAEATCTEPKTCTVCGETEGEALGHSWAEATCTESKTCTVCGETEGEPLGHTWAEATCLEPKTCTVCGETEGGIGEHSPSRADYWQGSVCTVCGEELSEPLQADFEKYGLDAYTHDAGLDEVYIYTTSGYGNGAVLPQYDAIAKVRSYGIVLKDENGEDLMEHWNTLGEQHIILPADKALVSCMREIEQQAGEGYEWRAVYFKVTFTNRQHGYSVGTCEENYYDIVGHDQLAEDLDTEEDLYLRKYPVVWQGEEKTVYNLDYFRADSYGDGWINYEVYYYVPVGYDGCVYGVYDQALTPEGWEDGKYIFDYMNENRVLFRLR